ncbi:MAG: alpha/beta fold hydrolase [Myxococcota bacterium]
MDGAWIDKLLLGRDRPEVSARRFSGSREGMRTLALGDALIRLRLAGSGSVPIALIPDPPNLIEHYDALFDLLAPDFRVLCLELPGFGLSRPKAGFDFSLDAQTRVVEKALRILDTGPCVVAFSCVAGQIGLKLACEQPDLVSHLALIQTPSWAEQIKWSRRVDPKRRISTPVLGQLLLALGKRKVARGWYAIATPDAATAERFDRVAREGFDRGAAYSLASAFQKLSSEPDPRFGTLNQRALVLWGMQDRTHRRTEKRSALAHLPNGTYLEFGEAGHFPELEQPERFRDALKAFLGMEAG